MFEYTAPARYTTLVMGSTFGAASQKRPLFRKEKPLMSDKELFAIRIALIQAFLRQHGYDGVLLSRLDNFAMATGGKRNYIYTVSDLGFYSLFITREGQVYYVGDNIEAPRVLAEEIGPFGCEIRKFLWCEGCPADLVKKEFHGALVSDDGSLGQNVHNDLAYVRALLSQDELEKYRRLGPLAADAVTAVAKSVRPGDAEADIAARLVAEGAKRRCLVPVALVAADERIASYRHPLPTEAPLLGSQQAEARVRRYVMIVGCFLKEGLIVSITRFRRVGDTAATIPDALARICGVDALAQEASQPGKTMGDAFAALQQAYTTMGFPENEWHNHHQGGTTGYAGRTCRAVPGDPFPILDRRWAKWVKEIASIDVEFGHAFAWNPSGVGVKSEDTFIMLPDGCKEIVTRTPEFPNVDLESVLGRPTDVVKSGMMV